jgi:hypothetical protein
MEFLEVVIGVHWRNLKKKEKLLKSINAESVRFMTIKEMA